MFKERQKPLNAIFEIGKYEQQRREREGSGV